MLRFKQQRRKKVGYLLDLQNRKGKTVSRCYRHLFVPSWLSYSFCAHCNEILCIACSTTNDCSVCDVRYCLSCSEEQGFEKMVEFCSEYLQSLCSLCRLDICKNTPYACVECKTLTFDTLLEECNSKQAQINALRLEIEAISS